MSYGCCKSQPPTYSPPTYTGRTYGSADGCKTSEILIATAIIVGLGFLVMNILGSAEVVSPLALGITNLAVFSPVALYLLYLTQYSDEWLLTACLFMVTLGFAAPSIVLLSDPNLISTFAVGIINSALMISIGYGLLQLGYERGYC